MCLPITKLVHNTLLLNKSNQTFSRLPVITLKRAWDLAGYLVMLSKFFALSSFINLFHGLVQNFRLAPSHYVFLVLGFFLIGLVSCSPAPPTSLTSLIFGLLIVFNDWPNCWSTGRTLAWLNPIAIKATISGNARWEPLDTSWSTERRCGLNCNVICLKKPPVQKLASGRVNS